jgi:hypothetical protein
MRGSCREFLRTVVLDLVAHTSRAVSRLERLNSTPRVHVLLLHEVLPTQQDAFRSLLERLSQHFRFVTFREAVGAIGEDVVCEPLMAFTFDDGRRNNWEAAGILEEFGARGCFYVCPDIVGVEDPIRVADFCRERLWMPPDRFLDWDQCRALVTRGHEIGGHTMSHPNLAAIDPRQAWDEILNCRRIIERELGCAEHFAWPYGRYRHMTQALVQAVYRCGWTSCASGERGCHIKSAGATRGPLVIRRESLQAAWPWQHVAWVLSRAVARSEGVDGWQSPARFAA